MPLFKVTGYPDEENIYHGHHTKIETWIVEAKNTQEAEKLGFEHFYYFHEVGVSEYKQPKLRLKVGDIIEIEHRPGDIVNATITFVGNDNNTRYRYSRESSIFGKIISEEILYDWEIEQGKILTLNGVSVRR